MFDWLRSRLGSRPHPSAALLREAENALRGGQPETARKIGLAILERSPGDPHALSLMSNIAVDSRQVEEGLRWAERAVAAGPALADAHYALARAGELAGEVERAEAAYRRVIALDPGHARAYNNLGCVLSYLERREEALDCFRRALELDPQQPEANQNYAAMAGDAAAAATAIHGYLEQIRRDPRDARAHNNLANLYSGLGRSDEARAHLEQAIALEPGRAEAHYSKGILLLSEGEYAEGWPEYEWRWRLGTPLAAPAHRFPQPIWDGRNLDGGTLFMHGELALGEAIQFARYARLAAGRCGAVVMECGARAKCVVERVAGVARATTPGEAPPSFAAHVPLFSLPRIFGTTLENMHWEGPYVKADRERLAYWKPRLETTRGKGLRIGLSWSGNPRNPNNRDRSIPLALLAPLLETPGVVCYSLQKDNDGASPDPARIVDLTPQIRDLLDTAAVIAQLDLVISVDTAVAHLAGAMGAPVWVLLNRTPDWRYHRERLDNPWYPSMRLYRQRVEGEWGPVIAEVVTDLVKRAALGQ